MNEKNNTKLVLAIVLPTVGVVIIALVVVLAIVLSGSTSSKSKSKRNRSSWDMYRDAEEAYEDIDDESASEDEEKGSDKKEDKKDTESSQGSEQEDNPFIKKLTSTEWYISEGYGSGLIQCVSFDASCKKATVKCSDEMSEWTDEYDVTFISEDTIKFGIDTFHYSGDEYLIWGQYDNGEYTGPLVLVDQNSHNDANFAKKLASKSWYSPEFAKYGVTDITINTSDSYDSFTVQLNGGSLGTQAGFGYYTYNYNSDIIFMWNTTDSYAFFLKNTNDKNKVIAYIEMPDKSLKIEEWTAQ